MPQSHSHFTNTPQLDDVVNYMRDQAQLSRRQRRFLLMVRYLRDAANHQLEDLLNSMATTPAQNMHSKHGTVTFNWTFEENKGVEDAIKLNLQLESKFRKKRRAIDSPLLVHPRKEISYEINPELRCVKISTLVIKLENLWVLYAHYTNTSLSKQVKDVIDENLNFESDDCDVLLASLFNRLLARLPKTVPNYEESNEFNQHAREYLQNRCNQLPSADLAEQQSALDDGYLALSNDQNLWLFQIAYYLLSDRAAVNDDRTIYCLQNIEQFNEAAQEKILKYTSQLYLLRNSQAMVNKALITTPLAIDIRLFFQLIVIVSHCLEDDAEQYSKIVEEIAQIQLSDNKTIFHKLMNQIHYDEEIKAYYAAMSAEALTKSLIDLINEMPDEQSIEPKVIHAIIHALQHLEDAVLTADLAIVLFNNNVLARIFDNNHPQHDIILNLLIEKAPAKDLPLILTATPVAEYSRSVINNTIHNRGIYPLGFLNISRWLTARFQREDVENRNALIRIMSHKLMQHCYEEIAEGFVGFFAPLMNLLTAEQMTALYTKDNEPQHSLLPNLLISVSRTEPSRAQLNVIRFMFTRLHFLNVATQKLILRECNKTPKLTDSVKYELALAQLAAKHPGKRMFVLIAIHTLMHNYAPMTGTAWLRPGRTNKARQLINACTNFDGNEKHHLITALLRTILTSPELKPDNINNSHSIACIRQIHDQLIENGDFDGMLVEYRHQNIPAGVPAERRSLLARNRAV